MRKKYEILICIAIIIIILFGLSGISFGAPEFSILGKTIISNDDSDPNSYVMSIQLLILLTILTLAPSILIMMTSFTRIIIVLAFIRNALGTQRIPPNQVLIGLALFLTFFIMAPIASEINEEAIQPFVKEQINQEEAFEKALKPIRKFMFKQTRNKDLALFLDISDLKDVKELNDIPTKVLIPSFIISELKTAFELGFIIYIPFLVVDMVVASTLMSMGMMMLPPVIISLPFKLLLFIMVDGWNLITKSLIMGFS